MLVFAIFVFAGLLVYFFYGRVRSTQEYALLHILEPLEANQVSIVSQPIDTLLENPRVFSPESSRAKDQCLDIDHERDPPLLRRTRTSDVEPLVPDQLCKGLIETLN